MGLQIIIGAIIMYERKVKLYKWQSKVCTSKIKLLLVTVKIQLKGKYTTDVGSETYGRSCSRPCMAYYMICVPPRNQTLIKCSKNWWKLYKTTYNHNPQQ